MRGTDYILEADKGRWVVVRKATVGLLRPHKSESDCVVEFSDTGRVDRAKGCGEEQRRQYAGCDSGFAASPHGECHLDECSRLWILAMFVMMETGVVFLSLLSVSRLFLSLW